jgi:hypothetical protein
VISCFRSFSMRRSPKSAASSRLTTLPMPFIQDGAASSARIWRRQGGRLRDSLTQLGNHERPRNVARPESQKIQRPRY